MRISNCLILVISLATSLANLFAQTTAPTLLPDGGGPYELQQTEACLTTSARAYIQAQLQLQTERLQAEGKLPMAWSRSATSLDWPLEVSSELEWPNYYGISGFVDQLSSSQTSDYSCGDRTYDGHKGTDYFTWPFPWYQYEHDFVSVVAAAPGVILWKQDGNDDDECVWGNNQWNAIYVTHADGSVAWYGHMKKNGLTNKGVGDQVLAGEFLGYLASSGRSSGPHLHLELYSATNELIDPYNGNCDDLAAGVSWANQHDYKETTINAILTHDAPPVHGCPSIEEQPNFSNSFDIGAPIYVGIYLRDQLTGTSATIRILAPNGNPMLSWSQSFSNNYNASWWWWSRNLPVTAPSGTYTVELNYEGQTETHNFTYGKVSSTAEAITTSWQLGPNPTKGNITWQKAMEPGTLVKLFAANGQLLDQRLLAGNSYDLSQRKAGLYFLQFERGGRIVSTHRVLRKP